MTLILFDSRNESIQQNGVAVEVCGPNTGHAVRVIAFCENSVIAGDIVAALHLWRAEREKVIKAA